MGDMNYVEFIKEKFKGKKVCMFPMGIAAKGLYDKLSTVNIDIDFFSDNNSSYWGGVYRDKICISPAELAAFDQDNLIVIVESLYYKEIKESLKKLGIKNIFRLYFEKILAEDYLKDHEIEEQVQKVLDLCEDEQSRDVYRHLTNAWGKQDIEDNYFEKVFRKNQYFDDEIIEFREDEVFVDCGAYTGDTAEKFLEACNGKYEKMHLFELDPAIYQRLCENVPKLHKAGTGLIQCYPYGVSNENGEVSFLSGDSNSKITDASDIKDETYIIGKIRTLDDVLKHEKVTFIKMDIEGAEMGALKGAGHIIKEQKPILAICIYHSPEDMLCIPQYMKELVPEYKIFIRHYTDLMLETVCYAIPESRIKNRKGE